jgi:adenine-specific DNA-methyltransferase
LRPWSHQKSLYCSKSKCVETFEDLIKNSKCKFILFSYNTEGIIPHKDIFRILSLRGEVVECKQDYRRYKSNSKGEIPKQRLKELLFFVNVNKS